MPSRIQCAQCQASFAYSPALLGKTVRCRQCQHTFTITAPPPEEPAPTPAAAQPAAPSARPPGPTPAAPSAKTPSPSAAPTPVPRTPAPPGKASAPPPLPPRAAGDKGSRPGTSPARVSGQGSKPDIGSKSGATRRPDRDDDDRPAVGRDRDREEDDEDDRPSRKKPARVEHPPAPSPDSQSGTLLLLGLIAAFVFGFLIIAAGIAYILWPSSSPPPPDAVQTPTAPANPVAAAGPPELPIDILDARPNHPPEDGVLAGPPPPGPRGLAPLPEFDVPRFEPPGPINRPPRVGPRRPPAIELPGRPPAPPRGNLAAPRFAPVEPLPITPAPLGSARVERVMPAPIESVVVAGGGRLLLLHLPREGQLAVFDVSKGQRVKLIPAPADAMIAGGMNLFVIYLPGRNVLERWNTKSLLREAELKDVFPDEVKTLAMGSATNGPLAAALGGGRKTFHGGATLAYFDPTTGKEVGYQVGGDQNPFGLGLHDTPIHVRVSADGSVVTGFGRAIGPEVHAIDGGQITRYWKHIGPHWAFPGPDGRTLYGLGTRFPTDLKTDDFGRPDITSPVWFLPAAHGDYFITARTLFDRPGRMGTARTLAEVSLGADARSILSLGEIADLDLRTDFFNQTNRPADHSLALIPDARVLAVVPTKNRDRLVLYRADVESALTKASFDYLFVTSRPPTVAIKGEEYRYAVAVKSKKGGVKVTLEAGPKGMSVTSAGAVAWDVPKHYPDADAGVILLVKDDSGKEVFHTFRLSVRGDEKSEAKGK